MNLLQLLLILSVVQQSPRATYVGRLRTIGFEIGVADNTSVVGFTVDGAATAATTSVQSTIFRSGQKALKCDSGAGNGQAMWQINLTTAEQALARFYYARVYERFTHLPGITTRVAEWVTTGGGLFSCRLTSGGKLQLFDNITGGGTQIGSDSAITVNVDDWYRIEMSIKVIAGMGDSVELRVNGVSVASSVLLNITDNKPASFSAGWLGAPGANKVMYIDDVAINDDQGASQATWPGEGKIVLLKPISDANVGAWTGGAGGTSNLFEALDNTPPAGLISASQTDTSQINAAAATANSTDEYRCNLTSYANAGIVAADTITLVHALADHDEPVAGGTKTGSFRIESNPAQTLYDTLTFGEDAGACGTWPYTTDGSTQGYYTQWGAAQVAPSVTLATSPVLTLRSTGTGTTRRQYDFAGVYVEYVYGSKMAVQSLRTRRNINLLR